MLGSLSVVPSFGFPWTLLTQLTARKAFRHIEYLMLLTLLQSPSVDFCSAGFSCECAFLCHQFLLHSPFQIYRVLAHSFPPPSLSLSFSLYLQYAFHDDHHGSQVLFACVIFNYPVCHYSFTLVSALSNM